MSSFASQHKAGPGLPVSLWLIIPALLLQLVPDWQTAFQYDRAGEFEFWRWITGHWTHWSFDHFLWDAIVMVIVGIFCERMSKARFAVCLIVSVLVIPLTVQWCLPEIQTYRGLSGLGSALFGLLVSFNLRKSVIENKAIHLGLWFLIGLCFIGKILYETGTGVTLFVDSVEASFIAVPLVHLVGFGVGIVSGIVPSIRKYSVRNHAISGARIVEP